MIFLLWVICLIIVWRTWTVHYKDVKCVTWFNLGEVPFHGKEGLVLGHKILKRDKG